MQNKTSPIILTFGSANPIGATGIYADLATFSAMGCYGLPVVTSIAVGDTTQIDHFQSIDIDLIADQARIVLEDMPVSAFKIGTIADVDSISTIAEIISDYPEIPCVLDPFAYYMQSQATTSEDLLIAISELLIPQATLLIASGREIDIFAESWRESSEKDLLTADIMDIIETGAEYVLVTDIPQENNDIANMLYDTSGLLQKDSWQRPDGTFLDVHSTLSAAAAALFAQGMPVTQAMTEAQEYTLASMRYAQRLGMGKQLLDHYFWAREDNSSAA